MSTAITDVIEGGYVKVNEQWQQIRSINLIYRGDGRLRSWYVTTDAGVHDMFDCQMFATRAEHEEART